MGGEEGTSTDKIMRGDNTIDPERSRKSYIASLERTRSGYKGQVTMLLGVIEGHEAGTKSLTLEEGELLSTKLTKLEQKASDVNDKIFEMCELETETTQAVGNAFQFDQKLLEVGSRLKVITKSLTVSPPATSLSSSSNQVKLPRMELPAFDGRYETWQSFQDLFIATVEKNSSLSGAQKLQYLKSCVKGEAANLIKSFTVTDTHYREAWGLLTDRYDNKREITNSLIKRICHQASLKQEAATGLQNILDVTSECLRSLKVLQRPVDHWDDLIVFIIVEKLDPETRREWAMSIKGTEPPTFKELHEFLEQHIRGLQASGLKGANKENHQGQHKSISSSHHINVDSLCPECKGNHALYICPKFKALSPNERSIKVKESALCNNCLKPNHLARECPSKGTCRKCSRKHHTMLHFERRGSRPEVQSQESSVQSCATATTTTEFTQPILMTARVHLSKVGGSQRHVARAFLDPGSEANIISEECVKALGLRKERADVSITGLSSVQVGRSQSKVTLQLHSLAYEATMEVEALVLPKVTSPMPKVPFNSPSWSHLKGLQLADPDYCKPSKIDILLGVDIYSSILREGVKSGSSNSPTAQHTLFGWVLLGRASKAIQQQSIVKVHHISSLESTLEKFWKIEELPLIKHYSPEEKLCEQHFHSTHTRDASGRFVVRLPFNDSIHHLGSSRDQAMRRFNLLERRFKKYPEYRNEYIKFMRDYETRGHMQIVDDKDVGNKHSYYLPHHFVLNQHSTTTKLRVVFDGSAKTSSGISLNNAMRVGPTIQDDLFTLLLRFRTHQIALKADIAKMYRQFKVNHEDANYQRIFWREDPAQPLREYMLCTLTYGTSAASYLATKCLQQLAQENIQAYPFASQSLDKDFYVDDLIGGGDNSNQVICLQQELRDLLSTAGMEIRKFMSNSMDVLQAIPQELLETKDTFALDSGESIPALGVQWNPKLDSFGFQIHDQPSLKVKTKRELLSELAKVFDPLGFLSPITIKAKIIFQDLWKESLGWDEPLNNTFITAWATYQNQLSLINSLRIPRCTIIPNAKAVELHGFSDASEKAYAAVVYLKSWSNEACTVRMIASKTKVAPVKQISLPRLELCGSLLLSELMQHIQESCKFKCPMTAWTDSTIVLRWLEAFPGKWKTFVANRVAKIQDDLPRAKWKHVKSEDNPADLPSRGISPEDLLKSELWWHGPSWLSTSCIPDLHFDANQDEVEKEEKKSVLVGHTKPNADFLTKYSSLAMLVRTTSWIMRFFNNSHSDKSKVKGPLTPSELQSSLYGLIKVMQAEEFGHDLAALASGNQLHHKSQLRQLYPFIDGFGLLRVGGRLQHSSVADNQKHPIILSHKHHLTYLIIRKCHFATLHGGFRLVHSTLSQDYWITRGRDSIRNQLRKCVVCRRQRAKTAQQLMGSLPAPRVNPGPPFIHCGVDYAGPFSLLKFKGRGAKTMKAYFALYVCFATKAIHLEAVTDLTSESFIASFKRFVARRGRPSHMHSDCGTNFVGADKDLQEMCQSSQFNQVMANALSDLGTQWLFNAPSAAYQGGLWEVGVKAVKYHFRRVVGNTNLTLEEFQTLLCNIEAILNSRPLCALSPDPNDIDVLTPGHFLIGRPLTAIPEPDLREINTNRLSRWQLVQQMTQHF